MKLCYCNNCMSVLEDTNPLPDAQEYSDILEPHVAILEHGEDEDGPFRGCPNCKTDRYLSDDIPLEALKKVEEVAAERAFFKSHPELNP